MVYSITEDNKDVLASSEGEEEGAGDEGEEQLQNRIEEEEEGNSIAEDFLEGVQTLEEESTLVLFRRGSTKILKPENVKSLTYKRKSS